MIRAWLVRYAMHQVLYGLSLDASPGVFPILVNNPKWKVFFLGVVYFFIASVEPWIWSGLGFFFTGLLLINKLFQVTLSDQSIQENLHG